MNDPSNRGVLRFLVQHRLATSVVSLVLALAVAVLTLLLSRSWPTQVGGLGILLGLLIFGLVNVFLDVDEDKQVSAERVLVLWSGGIIGLATALGGLLYGYFILWNDLLSWMTPGGERSNGVPVLLSLVALIGGVATMFFSFRLVQGEERQRPVLRRIFYGYNAFLTGFLLLLNLLVFNTFVSAWTQKPEDFTANKVHTLSSTSENLLTRLQQPVRVFVILNPGAAYGGLDLVAEMRQLLVNSKQHSDRIAYQFLDQLDANDLEQLTQMSTHYPAVVEAVGGRPSPREGVLILYGDKDPADYRFVSANDLFTAGGGREAQFRGEEAFMVELSFLMDDQKKTTVYFTQGNGEPSLDGKGPGRFGALRRQLNSLKRRLEKRNYVVKSLTFDPTEAAVPTDADMVVVAGPQETLPDYAVRALDEYWNKRQGKLVILLDLMMDASGRPRPSGLEELLLSNHISLRNERVIALTRQPVVSILVTSSQGSSSLAAALTQARFAALMPRPVNVHDPRQPGGRRSEALVVTAQPSVIDSDPSGDPIQMLQSLARNQAELKKRVVPPPITVAALVSDPAPFDPRDPRGMHGSVEQKPRMAVFGSSSLLYDELIDEDSGVNNFDLFTSVLDWLRERKGNLGIGPKVHNMYSINPTVSDWRLVGLPFGLILIALTGSAMGVWLVRRR